MAVRHWANLRGIMPISPRTIRWRGLVKPPFLALLLALLQACVAVPRTTSVYDEACKVHRRQMVLDMYQVGAFGGCANEGCLVLLAATGAVAAASVVVSGTIVVVGNVVYWFERQVPCMP